MHGIGHDHAHVTINTRAAVPPAVGLRGIVHAHGQHVGCREVQLRRQVERETGVSVRMRSELVAVEIYRGVPVDSVKLDADLFALPLGGSSERLAIPACSRRKETAPGAAWIVLIGRAFNAPVMRKIYSAPRAIGKRFGFSATRVAEEESPVGVRRQHQPGRLHFCGGQGNSPEQRQSGAEGNGQAR